MNTLIPLYFYPTQKLLLDDDEEFSQSIRLSHFNRNIFTHNCPDVALNYLLNEYSHPSKELNLINMDVDCDSQVGKQTIHINIENLKTLVLSNNFRNEISTLFVDYHMPKMSGLDFLSKINHLPVKKVLVTGEKDYAVGLNAFNRGLVDGYVRKDASNFVEQTQKMLDLLEWRYFTSLSGFVFNVADFDYLNNEELYRVFNLFFVENNVEAFCLVDVSGTFLVRTKQGDLKYFIVRTKNQLLDLSNVAKEDGGSELTIRSLEQLKSIPFFDDKQYWQIPASDWDLYFHKANRLQNNSDFVWSVVEYA